MSTETIEQLYQRYLRVCERARAKALPYADWLKWHGFNA